MLTGAASLDCGLAQTLRQDVGAIRSAVLEL
jgi:hypothetical protein